jgi:hypothetical protein
MEFITVDGELWAASHNNLDACDGQHVEVLFINEGYDLAQVKGVLRCSHQARDLQRMHALLIGAPQGDDQRQDEVLIKIIPRDAEVLRAIHPSNLHKNQEKAG